MVANGQANGAAEGGEGKSQARIELDAELGMKDGPVVDDFVDATRCQILYQNLKYTVEVKKAKGKGTETKELLRGMSGVINPGRLTAVMGASGAGKTTFLNALAGMQSKSAKVQGVISVNGDEMTGDMMRRISGFVHQEDVIMDTMTVREALMFAAELKLPKDMPYKDKVRRVMAVTDMLNLRKALDNVVGSSLIKGISGGEKRRLSLGMEMITNPSILFLDEPTSGLDSFTAYKVARILRNVAHRYGRTIVCTIHQPSSEVFNLFDDLIVLAEGQVAYHGLVSDMVPYFASIDYKCPSNFNPADFLFMSVLHAGSLSKDNDDAYDFITDKANDEDEKAKARQVESQRIQQVIDAWNMSERNAELQKSVQLSQASMRHGVHESAIQGYASFMTQLRLLTLRASRNQWRNDLILKGKIGQSIGLAVIVGLIFLQVGDDQTSIQDRQGSLFFIAVQSFFGATFGVMTVFGGEKAVFKREYGSRMYTLPAYFISRTAVTLPPNIILPIVSSSIMYWMIGYQAVASKFFWFCLIMVLIDNCGAACGVFVGCLFNDIAVAITVMPVFLLPVMVFSGFFVNSESLGWWFRWISYISPMKYGFIAFIVNEFTGLTITCDPNTIGCTPSGTESGETVIDLLGFSDSGGVGQNAGILFALFWGFLLLAYVALWAAVRRQANN